MSAGRFSIGYSAVLFGNAASAHQRDLALVGGVSFE